MKRPPTTVTPDQLEARAFANPGSFIERVGDLGYLTVNGQSFVATYPKQEVA